MRASRPALPAALRYRLSPARVFTIDNPRSAAQKGRRDESAHAKRAYLFVLPQVENTPDGPRIVARWVVQGAKSGCRLVTTGNF
uniref:Uncharacterized protein n=1 Tax=Candidatus Kentrum eta TaxID=2126337 RepID=A0A450UDW3_9GAMM|nr:MAG: hypothetical protein BECKH772A_GA0070896_1002227 [Candidatus Kentron sp. H]VFJ91710.1 MAG: hypothetical protein BECKH772B_GA0070898_1002027 [Candidatus Kentron sp. H]VFJ98341.1 MAG: hypothetical protein BECKH772C_GA0070978_1002027 [Candidatus Kentron sp. H]